MLLWIRQVRHKRMEAIKQMAEVGEIWAGVQI